MLTSITGSLLSPRLGRLPAILSLIIVLFGKSVHLHQEIDCCSSDSATEAESQSSHCEFGCKHHTPTIPSNTDQDQDQDRRSHDSHHCMVCSLLTQTPDVVAIVEVEATADLIMVASAVSERLSEICVERQLSRGPPTT
ncbi:MAG: hypothetical protein MK102_12555 [Fuerstiella sp.]|nr:hypothetical protein [Fuerstiella sp.]